jgi:hypothetical protein
MSPFLLQAAQGTPYTDLAKQAVDLEKKRLTGKHAFLQGNMAYPTLDKVGPYYYFNKAFEIGAAGKEEKIPAKSFVTIKFLLYLEWDLQIDEKDCIQVNLKDKADNQLRLHVLEVPWSGARQPTQEFQQIPLDPDSQARIFKLKTPTKEGANYRIIYADTPGVIGVIFAQTLFGKPAPQNYYSLEGSFAELELTGHDKVGFPTVSVVEKSRIDFKIAADWTPPKMTFKVNGTEFDVEPK